VIASGERSMSMCVTERPVSRPWRRAPEVEPEDADDAAVATLPQLVGELPSEAGR
jgi:hypothetical protein